jgi:hypothetical protein
MGRIRMDPVTGRKTIPKWGIVGDRTVEIQLQHKLDLRIIMGGWTGS